MVTVLGEFLSSSRIYNFLISIYYFQSYDQNQETRSLARALEKGWKEDRLNVPIKCTVLYSWNKYIGSQSLSHYLSI